MAASDVPLEDSLLSRICAADGARQLKMAPDRDPQLQDELHLTQSINRGCSPDSGKQPLLIGMVVATPS